MAALKRFSAVAAVVFGLMCLPLSLASATPVTLQIKGEIGNKADGVISIRSFKSTMRLEPGKSYKALPSKGRGLDYSVSVKIEPLQDGAHRVTFKIIDHADPAHTNTFEPSVTAQVGEPAKVQLDRGGGVYVSMEADIEN